MSKDTSGPAFPVPDEQVIYDENRGMVGAKGYGVEGHSGMSLRDYLAAKALQGLLACPGDEVSGSYHSNSDPGHTAKMAYEYSDAMLAARNA